MITADERKKLVDRVVKLLALAKGTNHTGEAETAKRMAAELMAKHNISIADEVKKEGFKRKWVGLTRKSPIRYDLLLIHIISKFNNVLLISHEYEGGRQNADLEYVGREVDIEVNFYMLDLIFQQRKAAWEKAKESWKMKDLGTGRVLDSTRTQWHNGFSQGVGAKIRELEKMASSKTQEWGLVPIDVTKQALMWYNEQGKPSKPTKVGGKAKLGREGYEAGKNVNLNKGIGNDTGKARKEIDHD